MLISILIINSAAVLIVQFTTGRYHSCPLYGALIACRVVRYFSAER